METNVSQIVEAFFVRAGEPFQSKAPLSLPLDLHYNNMCSHKRHFIPHKYVITGAAAEKGYSPFGPTHTEKAKAMLGARNESSSGTR